MGVHGWKRIIAITVLIAFIGTGMACKKQDDPIIPPEPVTLQFEIYNHTQGYRNQFSRTVLGGDSLVIKVSDLGVNDVDSKRIAVRQDNFGGLVTYSATGEAAFVAPKQNTNYDIILFNITPFYISNTDFTYHNTIGLFQWFCLLYFLDLSSNLYFLLMHSVVVPILSFLVFLQHKYLSCCVPNTKLY